MPNLCKPRNSCVPFVTLVGFRKSELENHVKCVGQELGENCKSHENSDFSIVQAK